MNVLLTKREDKWHDQKQRSQAVKKPRTPRKEIKRNTDNFQVLCNIALYYLATSATSIYFTDLPAIPFINALSPDVYLSVFDLMAYFLCASMVSLFCLAIIACKKLLTTQKTTIELKLVSVAYFIAVIMNVALMLDAKNTEVVSWLYELDDIAQTVIDLILVSVGALCMWKLMRSR